MITYTCKGCGERMESPDGMIGLMEPCPICGRKNQVPSPVQLAGMASEKAEKIRKARHEEERQAEFKRQHSGPAPQKLPCIAVAGIGDEDKQRLIKKCREKQPVLLVRKNKRAIHVCAKVGLFKRVKELGYVPETYAKAISTFLDRGWVAEAEIFSVIASVGLHGVGKRYGLRITGQLKPPDQDTHLAVYGGEL